MPHANWHHPVVRQSEHTKYSTYQQQSIGSKCSKWGVKMTTPTKLGEFSFYPMSTSVIECRGSGSRNSSGLCTGLPVTSLRFQLPLTTSIWHKMPVRGIKTVLKTYAIIQIKYVLPKLHHLPEYSYGSRDPTTQLLGFASSVLILWQVTPYDNPYLNCITMPPFLYC